MTHYVIIRDDSDVDNLDNDIEEFHEQTDKDKNLKKEIKKNKDKISKDISNSLEITDKPPVPDIKQRIKQFFFDSELHEDFDTLPIYLNLNRKAPDGVMGHAEQSGEGIVVYGDMGNFENFHMITHELVHAAFGHGRDDYEKGAVDPILQQNTGLLHLQEGAVEYCSQLIDNIDPEKDESAELANIHRLSFLVTRHFGEEYALEMCEAMSSEEIIAVIDEYLPGTETKIEEIVENWNEENVSGQVNADNNILVWVADQLNIEYSDEDLEYLR